MKFITYLCTILIVLVSLFFLCHGELDEESSNNSTPVQEPKLKLAENVTLTFLNDNETDYVEPQKNHTKYFKCLPGLGNGVVEIVNDTQLINILASDSNVTKETEGKCVLVMFYSKYCTFSTMAAPHFNALPRAFPDIKMVAINAMMYHLFNTQNGIVGIPSLLLFHNGKACGKFNDSDYTLDLFSKFITRLTDIAPAENSVVTSADFAGPVTSVPVKDSDIFLIVSWLFIIICGIYYFTKSRWWKWIVETVQNNWRESEGSLFLF